MASLEIALPTVFLHEGRYVDRKSDPGGATNYGISLRFLVTTGDLDHDGWIDGDINQDGKVDIEDIKAMAEKDAAKLYNQYFWRPNNYDEITAESIATKIFDLAINIGSRAANKCAQRAVRACKGKLLIEDDGIIGAKSIEAINSINHIILLPAIRSEAAGYYRQIKYKGSSDYIKGWLNRAYA